MFDTSKLSSREFVITTILSAVFYVILLCLFIHFLAPKKIEDCPKCKQAIANYIKAQKGKQNTRADVYNESLYNQSGGINPEFKNRVSKKTNVNAEATTRVYEKQLAQYRARLAEREQALKEAQRLEEEQAARERALIEQERAERLKQQELQKQQMLESQKAFSNTVVNTKANAPKSTGVQRTAKGTSEQKTQIGTLKTSKLGESSFQNQRF